MPRRRTGWRGPQFKGEYPTLGHLVIQWIEEYLVIPGGAQRGKPLQLTDEQGQHFLQRYRLDPRATVDPRFPRPRDGLLHYGVQLRRPQKWGKDPVAAANDIAAALGPVQFDGWDAYGEPVGRPVDAPWVQVAATSDEQTDNTFRPIYRMLSEGGLADLPGLDIGETRIKLPDGDGWIEPVTAAARSRLGQPLTHASFTEPHLMCERDGGLGMIRAMKRGLTGMGGTWGEYTNSWDPSENSAAQLTAESKAPGVLLDHRAADLPNLTPEQFADDDVVLERIVVKYGDSCRRNGGWVDEQSVLADIRDAATGEAEARRYYLDEITVGQHDAVDATRWHALGRPGEGLDPGSAIALGFDGSRSRDATALIAARIIDGRWFKIGVWDPAEHGGKVPENLVDEAVRSAMAAYQVWHLIADPFKWHTSIDAWAGAFPTNPAGKSVVVEFATNAERRMDAAIELWETAYRHGEGQFTHDADETVTRHALNAAIATSGRKAPREDEEPGLSNRYKKIVKKKQGLLIDAYVAGILATHGRGMAIEEGALVEPEPAVAPWVMFT